LAITAVGSALHRYPVDSPLLQLTSDAHSLSVNRGKIFFAHFGQLPIDHPEAGIG
jgi:hypothetical protein